MHILNIQQLTTNLALIERKVNFFIITIIIVVKLKFFFIVWYFTVLELNEFLFAFHF